MIRLSPVGQLSSQQPCGMNLASASAPFRSGVPPRQVVYRNSGSVATNSIIGNQINQRMKIGLGQGQGCNTANYLPMAQLMMSNSAGLGATNMKPFTVGSSLCQVPNNQGVQLVVIQQTSAEMQQAHQQLSQLYSTSQTPATQQSIKELQGCLRLGKKH